jgi:hypothetical protein
MEFQEIMVSYLEQTVAAVTILIVPMAFNLQA